MSRRGKFVAVLVVVLAGLLAAVVAVRARRQGELVRLASVPAGIMGTECRLQAVVRRADADRARAALRQAEQALRAVETRMSTYIELSELSRLNAAPAGQVVELSAETMAVLRLGRDLHEQTGGAFDVTCLPVFRLWGRAGKLKRLPTDTELAAARASCGWDKFELGPDGVRKSDASGGIGLGGVAKGFAIDQAIEAMIAAGCAGGLVDVGGDIRCFGLSPRRGPWRVAVQDPFNTVEGGYFGTLELTDLAVCTSGNYRRFTEIDGKRYSHIVDPRSGRPVDFAPSVTVVAPTAGVADGWATALSVLGPAGLRRIKPAGGIEAMIVVGGPDDYTIHQTPGFAKLLASPVPPASGPARRADRPSPASAPAGP